jgi:hypothetical protein
VQSGVVPPHGGWSTHWPVELHTCGVLPEQPTAPELHVPTQAPFTQVAFRQASGEPHAPAASHVSTPLSEHRVSCGAQSPTQAPAEHAWCEQAGPFDIQAPLESQICGCEPAQTRAPWVHVPVHAPDAHVCPGQDTVAPHSPVGWH